MKNYNYTIYQVKAESEFAFMRWDMATKYGWSFNSYREVWKGSEEARDDYNLLNYLFEMFNLNHPNGYKGHSMSVSDIVKVCSEECEAKYYYCNSFGWEDITEYVKKGTTTMTKQEKELKERMMAVKAMEYMARQVNDESTLDIWLMGGVADGDIEYGDFTIHSGVETDPAYDYASDPDTFSSLMGCFLRTMSATYKSGGLWCGGIVSDD